MTLVGPLVKELHGHLTLPREAYLLTSSASVHTELQACSAVPLTEEWTVKGSPDI